MSEHPDLLELLRADLPNDGATATGDHLDRCDGCRRDLAELATAHALLTRSAHALGRVTGPEELVPLPAPPRARRLPLLVAAAVALVAALGGTTYVVLTRDDPAPPAVTAVLEPVEGTAAGLVEMRAADAGTRMTITTDGLPAAGPGRYYQAWLLDPATNKMLPLGQLGPDGGASVEVDDDLLADYSAVDVSLEEDDGDPAHSVTSVLRASYDAGP